MGRGAWAADHVYARGSTAWQVKSIINSVKPSTMDLVLWNNSLSLPLLVVLGLLLDDPAGLIASIPSISAHGWLVVIVSFVLAGQIAFAGFMLQAVVSPTSATLINHMVKVCTFVASHMVFHDQFGIWMVTPHPRSNSPKTHLARARHRLP